MTLTFDEIFRHVLDRQIGPERLSTIHIASAREKIEEEMLQIIIEQSLVDLLFARLGLFDLCRKR